MGAKVFDVAFTVFIYLLSAVILIAALMFASNTSPDKSLFGYRYYTILTGSMEPTYSVGDMIFVKLSDAKDINVGDVITFNPSQDSDAYLTHRVTEKLEDFEGTGVTCFRTRGDANNAEDSFLIDSSRVVGVVSFSLAKVGYIVRFVQLRWYLVIPVVIMIAVLFRLLKHYFLLGKEEDEDEEETAKGTPEKNGEKAGEKVDSDTKKDSGAAAEPEKTEPQPDTAIKAEEGKHEEESDERVSENKGS